MKTLRTLFTWSLLLCATQMMADIWQDPNTEVNYEYTVGTGEASVAKGGVEGYLPYAGSPDASGKITIRSKFTVNGKEYTVTSIGEYAFYNCTKIESITIPSTIISTDYQSFGNCSGLRSINLPSSMTTIGEYTFGYCSNLQSITIPANVTSIGRIAFFRCTGLTSMSVEEGNKVYDSRENCNAIIETATNTLIHGCQSTVIPQSVTSIGARVFNGCTGLTEITIPSKVTSIGDAAFFECTGLTSITIPSKVASIGSSAFANCKNLTKVTSHIREPFEVVRSAFEKSGYPNNEFTTATLYVPTGTKEKYQAISCWNEFKTITEIYIPETDRDPNEKVTVLTVNPVSIEPGGTSEIVVNIDYDTNETITGYNFYLYLPEGITLNTTESESEASTKQLKACFTLSEEIHPLLYNSITDEYDKSPKEALIVRLTNDGGRLIMWIDLIDKEPLKTTHGELMRISIKADNNIGDNLLGEIKEIAVNNKNNQSLDLGHIADVQFGINGGTPPILDKDNTIYMDDVEVRAGNEETLSLKMKNTAAIRGFQFTLDLPDGVTPVKSARGKIQASLSADRLAADDEHTLSVSENEDGTLLFTANSLYEETFTGNDGEVATLRVNVSNDMEDGDYDVVIKDVRLNEVDATKFYDVSRMESKLTVTSFIPGDVNGDGDIDVSDYIGVANRIHNVQQDGFNEKAADVVADGVINISDYVGVANLILTGNIHGSVGSRVFRMKRANTDVSGMDNVLYVEPFAAEAGKQVEMSVKMKNTAQIRGFQFDLALPEGVTAVKSAKGKIQAQLSADRLPEEDEHTLTVTQQADGTLRFLCGSEYEETFTGNDGEILTLTLDVAADIQNGSYPVVLSNIRLGENDMNVSYKTDVVESTLTIGNDEPGPGPDPKPIRGDVNEDGKVDVADIATVISIMAAQARLQMQMAE